MKRLLNILEISLAISSLAFPAFGQGKDISGLWTTTMTRGGQGRTFKMGLKVSGNHVTGTIDVVPSVAAEIQNGKLEGNQLTFDVTAPEHGRTKNIHFTGEVAGDAITLRNESNGKQGRTMIFQRAAM